MNKKQIKKEFEMNEGRLEDVFRQFKKWINRLNFNNQLLFYMGDTKIKLNPKMAQVYWCEFSPPVLPELGKVRPVVVLSRHTTRDGMVTVVPITTRPQRNAEKKHWVKIQSPFKGKPQAWVLCKGVYMPKSHFPAID